VNKIFFEKDFGRILTGYCAEEGCSAPLMHFTLKDGTTYTVNRIIHLGQDGICFRYHDDRYGTEEDEHYPSMMICPYEHVVEIKLHPRKAEKAAGFRLSRK
jgi:hypothetical protein